MQLINLKVYLFRICICKTVTDMKTCINAFALNSNPMFKMYKNHVLFTYILQCTHIINAQKSKIYSIRCKYE